MPSSSPAVPLVSFLLLAGALALKHVVADFLLQTGAIARGKERRRSWLGPLCLHALGHAGLTLALALVVAPLLWWLAVVDFCIHFAVDRAKSMLGHRLGLSTDDVRFWWLIGFDQFLHQLTNLGLAAALATL